MLMPGVQDPCRRYAALHVIFKSGGFCWSQDKNLWLQTSLEQIERRLDAARLAAAGGSGVDQDDAAVQLEARGANEAATPPSEEELVKGLKAEFEAKVNKHRL